MTGRSTSSNVRPWSIAAIIILVIVSLSVWEIGNSYNNIYRNAAGQTVTTGQLIAQWINSSLATPQYILKDAVNLFDAAELHYPNTDPPLWEERNRSLAQKHQSNEHILFLGLFDSSCRITHASLASEIGKDLHHREYCSLVFQEPTNGFKTSNMFVSSTGQVNVTMSYPMLGANDEISGFALVGLDLSFFQLWLDQLRETKGMVVSILDNKAQLLARTPFLEDVVGTTITSDIFDEFVQSSSTNHSFRSKSPLDQVDRYWTFYRVSGQPFVVVIGLSTVDLTADWWLKSLLLVAGNILLIATIVFGAKKYIQSDRLAQMMQELAVTDKLTGIFNRLKLDEVLNYELNRSERFGSRLGVVLLDLDHFKMVNDLYGHQVGDQCLIKVADILRKHSRKIDTVGRWGGEEFLIICPETDEQGSLRFADILRKNIEQEKPIGDLHQVTISCGVAFHRQGDTSDTLLARADAALYRMKNSGRNRVGLG